MEKNFFITINDMMFGNFNGTFIANSKEEAIEEALEFYANELDTSKEEINILEVKEVQ